MPRRHTRPNSLPATSGRPASVGPLAFAGGCGLVQIPVPLDLSGTSAGSFDAEAGVPTGAKTATFSGQDVPIEIGSGRISLDPSVVTVTPSDGSAGKSVLAIAAQEASVCLDACAAAGVDSDTCSTVCEQSQLQITIWVGPASITSDCESGVRYVVLASLNDDGSVASISVSPDQLQPETIELLNSGEQIGMCVDVLSPIDGTVLIGGVTLLLSP